MLILLLENLLWKSLREWLTTHFPLPDHHLLRVITEQLCRKTVTNSWWGRKPKQETSMNFIPCTFSFLHEFPQDLETWKMGSYDSFLIQKVNLNEVSLDLWKNSKNASTYLFTSVFLKWISFKTCDEWIKLAIRFSGDCQREWCACGLHNHELCV